MSKKSVSHYAVFLLFPVLFGLFAIRLGSDTNGDVWNYHWYKSPILIFDVGYHDSVAQINSDIAQYGLSYMPSSCRPCIFIWADLLVTWKIVRQIRSLEL